MGNEQKRQRTTREKIGDFISESTIPFAHTISAGIEDPSKKVLETFREGQEIAADRRRKLDKKRGTVSRKIGGSIKQSGHNKLY